MSRPSIHECVCVQDLNGHALPVHGIGRFYIYLEDVPHAVDLLVVDMDLSAILGAGLPIAILPSH